MQTLGLALMGTGRMAHVYGPKINAHPGLRLEVVYNPRIASAQKVADLYGGRPIDDLDAALADPRVDAVIIATPTDTHVDYIEKAAQAGKPIYCEKPLDQSLDRVDHALAMLEQHPVPFMLGFNRRFDPDNAALHAAVRRGDVGRLNMLMSWSREPAPPPIEYVRVSGGYFVDATIHDIDLLCWIAGEHPIEVMATGSCMFNDEIAAEDDFDMTMTTLKMPSGALVHINNSRACVYGFDQRLEALGDDGMVQTLNHRDDNLVRWDNRRTVAREPLKHFFLERYDQSFYNALDEFHTAITVGRDPSATAQDGRAALEIALACTESAKTGKAIKIVRAT